MADADKTYIGIEPCGCVTFVMIAGVESERSERAELAKVIKGGRRIEVVTAAEARERWGHCEHRPEVPEDLDEETLRLFQAHA